MNRYMLNFNSKLPAKIHAQYRYIEKIEYIYKKIQNVRHSDI